MDVRMPDGTLVKGVPDNITQEDLLARFNAYKGEQQPTPQQPAAKETPKEAPKEAIAAPETPAYKKVFNALEKKPEESKIVQAEKDIALSGAKGVVDVGQGAIGLRKLLSTDKDARLATASPITALMEKAFQKGEELAGYKEAPIEQQGKSLQQVQDKLQALKSKEQQQSELEVQQTKGFLPTVGALATHPRALTGAIAESIPSMLGSAGIARGLGSAGAGILTRAAVGEGVVSAGQTAEQASQANQGAPLTPEQKATSIISGTLTAGLGALGGKVATKLEIPDIKLLLAGGTSPAAKKSILQSAIADALNEAVIEELPQSMQEQIASNINSGRPWNEGVAEAGAAGAMAALGLGGIGGAYGQHIANRAETQQERQAEVAKQEALNKWATQGLAAKRAPQSAQTVTQPPAERNLMVQQYMDMGHTKDNAEALADQSIRETQEAANVQPTGRTDIGPDNISVPVSNVPGGNAPGLNVAPTTGLEGTEVSTKDVGIGKRAEPSALEQSRTEVQALTPEYATPEEAQKVLRTMDNPQSLKVVETDYGFVVAPKQAAPVEQTPEQVAPETTAFMENLGVKPKETEAVQEAPAQVAPQEVVREEVRPEVKEGKTLANLMNREAPGHSLVEALRSPDVTQDHIEQAREYLQAAGVPLPKVRATEAAQPPAAEDVHQALQGLFTPTQLKANPPVVVNSYDELPEGLKQQAQDVGAKAFVDPSTGREYYVADKMSRDNIRGTILHERGAHIGLTNLIGAFRVRTLANRVTSWAAQNDSSLESTIAKLAVAAANASGEEVGSDRYNQEVIAYFTEYAVNKFGIDPTKTQPKAKQKVAEWLRSLWTNIAQAVRKLNIDPSTLTTDDVVNLVYGAARLGTSKLSEAETKAVFTPEVLNDLSAALANSPVTEADIPKEEPRIQASKAMDEAKKAGFDKPGIGRTFYELFYDQFKQQDLKAFVKNILVNGISPAPVVMTSKRVLAGLPPINLQNYMNEPNAVTQAWSDPITAADELSRSLSYRRESMAKDSHETARQILRDANNHGLYNVEEYILSTVLLSEAISKYSMAGNRIVKMSKDNEYLPIDYKEVTPEFISEFVSNLTAGTPLKTAFESAYKDVVLAPRTTEIQKDLGPSQTGWIKFTDPSQAEKLKLLTSDTGTAPSPWCIGRSKDYGESYLKDYNMYVYEDKGQSILAVRTKKDTDAPYDWYGIGPSQAVLREHESLKETLPTYATDTEEAKQAVEMKHAFAAAEEILKKASVGDTAAVKYIARSVPEWHPRTETAGALRDVVKFATYAPILTNITGLSQQAFNSIQSFENLVNKTAEDMPLLGVYPELESKVVDGKITFNSKYADISKVPDSILTPINELFKKGASISERLRGNFKSAQDYVSNYIQNNGKYDLSGGQLAILPELIESALTNQANIHDISREDINEALKPFRDWYYGEYPIEMTSSVDASANLEAAYVPVSVTDSDGTTHVVPLPPQRLFIKLGTVFPDFEKTREPLYRAKKEYKVKLADLLADSLAADLKNIHDQQAPAIQASKAEIPPILASKVKKQKVKVDKTLEKIKRSKKTYQDAADFMGEIGHLIKDRSFDEVKDILGVIIDTSDSKVLAGLMGALTTDQVTRLVGDKIPHLKEINMYMERMSVMRNKMLAGGADIATPWAAFIHKHKEAGTILHDLMHYSTIANVDPTKFPNAAAALAGDTILADLQNKINAAKTTREAASYKGQFNTRVLEINKVYKDYWDKLGRIENGEGQKIYKLAKDHYKTMFDLHRLILDERIAELRIPGDVQDPNSPKGRLMAEIRKTYEGAKELGTYFPLMRYGQYWLSKGTGKNREFYMFESEFQRNMAYVKRIRDMQRAGDIRTKKQIMESGEFNLGNNLSALRENSAEASELLKAIFGEIDKTGVGDKEALKDQIYQMYLMTMPEQSFRKQFIHRKETTGFNPDALRNFVRSVYNNANQLSRLKYGSKVMQEMGAARDSLMGLADNTKIKHETILDEIDRRVMAEVAPKFEDGVGEQVASLTNKVAFMYLLSAPKTAINNMTAIPIYGIPVLTAEFGPLASATLPKYMNVFNQLANTKKNADGSVSWKPFSVGHMPFVMKSPVLSAAFEEAAERGVTDITRTYDMLSAGKTPSENYQGIARRGTRAVVQLLGFMFHHSERLNREVMYMTAFDLAYKKYLKDNNLTAYSINSNVIHEDAFQYAVKKAVDVVYESMFNYTRYNRPRYMRSAPARVLLQFKLYPQQVTAYYVRNFYTMLPMIEGHEAKKEAATKFFGTMMMTGLFSGVGGLFLYSTIMGILQGIRNWWRDKKDEPVYVNEKDLDAWFRYEYLPETLGPDMARMVEKGPVNYFTGADVATGTSANNLWFRDGKPDASFAGTVDNWLFANSGPGVSLFSNTMGAMDDFENGNMEDGYAKLSPNLIKNPIIAYKWSKEGILTKQRAPIFDQDEVTKGMLFAKAIGYSPSKVAFLQERNFKYAAVQAEVLAERETLLRQYTNALDKDDDKLIEKVEDAIDKFNSEVPREERISASTKSDARASARERIRKAQQGLQLKPGFRREFSEAIMNTEQNP